MKDIVDQLNGIIDEGIRLRASDIHIEPRDKFVSIRYRVDGTLQYGPRLDKDAQAPLVSRIKVMVGLDIAESRLPQDGRGKHSGVDLRISTIPTLFGEKIVIRLLEFNRTLLPLSELGMTEGQLDHYRRMIASHSGIILVTGPTGSGKTTTLYATLKELNYKEKNITTIEDPVEYQLFGINQIQVN
ncbi:MAG: ATPase, T2SS/T4P/T4SS family, partial [Candidatus Margulisiibacteriota bacterium]